MENKKVRLCFEEKAGSLKSLGLSVMQINIGRYCNLVCSHCHVDASPNRKEMMSRETMDIIISVLSTGEFETVELTGGAPELHPLFREFLYELKKLDIQIVVRTNLTALLIPKAEGVASLMKELDVQLIASLPYFEEEKVQVQRGEGVFEESITALKMLNSIGYGIEEGLSLTLVYNPEGGTLPGNQKELEDLYRRELGKEYGISFSRLIALANMPVGRFYQELLTKNKDREYIAMLEENYNREVLDKLMCRRNISVDWDGTLYDCDFNLALGVKVIETPSHISSFHRESFKDRRIVTNEHCFGCTAGSGSSCGGTLEVCKN